MITGAAIGLLIGLVTGIVFLLLLKTADQASEQGASVLKVTTEILAILFVIGLVRGRSRQVAGAA